MTLVLIIKNLVFDGATPKQKRNGFQVYRFRGTNHPGFFSQDLSQRPSRCSFGCGRSTGTNFGGKNACFVVFWTREKLQGSLNGTHFGGHQTLQIYVKSRGISLVVVHCLGWSYNDPWETLMFVDFC